MGKPYNPFSGCLVSRFKHIKEPCHAHAEKTSRILGYNLGCDGRLGDFEGCREVRACSKSYASVSCFTAVKVQILLRVQTLYGFGL